MRTRIGRVCSVSYAAPSCAGTLEASTAASAQLGGEAALSKDHDLVALTVDGDHAHRAPDPQQVANDAQLAAGRLA